jgi:hypothetical protein
VQVKPIGYGIRWFYRVAKLWHLWEMTLKDAQERLKILRFWDRHGLKAPPARDAFGVFRAKDPSSGGEEGPLRAGWQSRRARWLLGSARAPSNAGDVQDRNLRLAAQIRSLQSLYPPTSAKRSCMSCLPPLVRGEGHRALPSVLTIGRFNGPRPGQNAPIPRLDTEGRHRPPSSVTPNREKAQRRASPSIRWKYSPARYDRAYP